MLLKKINDYILRKFIYGNKLPIEIKEMREYFNNNGPVTFDYVENNDGVVAISNNFRRGSIITEAKTKGELDEKIKDAILTSFEIPSSYANEANIIRVGDKKEQYAAA